MSATAVLKEKKADLPQQARKPFEIKTYVPPPTPPIQPEFDVVEAPLPPRRTLLHWFHEWPHFCRRFCLKQVVDFEKLEQHPTIMNRPIGFDWIVYEPAEMSLKIALANLCNGQFSSKLDERLHGFCSSNGKIVLGGKDIDPPTTKPRLWLCRSTNAPDQELIGATWGNLVEKKTVFMDPTQRAILEAVHYFIYRSHLDTKDNRPWTSRMPRSYPVFKKSAKVSADFKSRILTATAFWNGKEFCLEADQFLNNGDDQGGPREILPVSLDGYTL